VLNKGKLIDWQGPNSLPVSRNAAQVTVVIVPVVFTIRWIHAGTLRLIPVGQENTLMTICTSDIKDN